MEGWREGEGASERWSEKETTPHTYPPHHTAHAHHRTARTHTHNARTTTISSHHTTITHTPQPGGGWRDVDRGSELKLNRRHMSTRGGRAVGQGNRSPPAMGTSYDIILAGARIFPLE